MRGGSPQPPPLHSTHLGDAQQPFCSRTLTTHQLEVRRETLSQLHKAMIRWPDGKSQDTGELPPLCSKCMGSLMTTMSQDCGLMSHPEDAFCYITASPSLDWNLYLDQRAVWPLLAHQHHFQKSPTQVVAKHTPAERQSFIRNGTQVGVYTQYRFSARFD